MASQWEWIEHGDPEAAMVDILLNLTPELGAFGPPTISTNLIGYTYGSRWISISLEGAMERWPAINRPRIDVEVLAERRSVAHDISSICLASVKYQMGRYRGNGLFLSDAILEQGFTRVPDRYEEESRYSFAFRFTTRPSGSVSPLS
jgi:hypothetical protein